MSICISCELSTSNFYIITIVVLFFWQSSAAELMGEKDSEC